MFNFDANQVPYRLEWSNESKNLVPSNTNLKIEISNLTDHLRLRLFKNHNLTPPQRPGDTEICCLLKLLQEQLGRNEKVNF